MFSLLPFLLFAGITGKIQGIVRNEENKEGIPYADVILLNTEIGTATDERGNFFILNVPPGRYTIEISCLGFQTKRIENVIVEIDQTTRLNVSLKPGAIELAPVVVFGETPAVKKDYVGSTQIIRKVEVMSLPIDYTPTIIAFQAAVAHTDTALHVRGGRATEVQYMIDNIPVIDPLTGEIAINLSKGVLDEVIFLPGGFDVEYGRAMSGVVNLITERPQNIFQGRIYGKTERIMPFYYDFGYENFQSTVHLPVSNRLVGLISFDLMHTDDWDPRLYILPHKQRDDYSLYGKYLYSPTDKIKLILSGAKSRIQFDRYTGRSPFFKFHLDHYRSDMRNSDLEALHLSYLPNTKNLFNLNFSRLFTEKEFGVRQENGYNIFDNFVFCDYTTLRWPRASIRNPFGAIYHKVISEGDYPQYERKSSRIYNINLKGTLQVHRYHELKTGIEYILQKFDRSTYYVCGDTLNPLVDEYTYNPIECSGYIQDNIDYQGFYAKLGLRYDLLLPNIPGAEPHKNISPRLGCSFLVTEKFLFRVNIGRYLQPPLYDQLYNLNNLLPLPTQYASYIPIIGNPNLAPEKTTSYELGLLGEIKRGLIVTTNFFYKDVSDLVGTRYVTDLPLGYHQYYNIEYANIKGAEVILEFNNTSLFTGKISYTLSWAKGTSSYAGEYADTSIIRPTTDYYLDFDQRHRIFIQGGLKGPLGITAYLFGYFGNGFPYTPPSPEGKYQERNIFHLPFQHQIDCVFMKTFRIEKFPLNIQFEILNLLDERYEVTPHYPLIPLEEIHPWDFNNYLGIQSPYYSPAADLNHDGLVVPYEEYTAFRELIRATDDWVNAYTAPRRARLGLGISF